MTLWRAWVQEDPISMRLQVALGRRVAGETELVAEIGVHGITCLRQPEGTAYESVLAVPVDVGRALLDGLTGHFGGTSDTRRLRADYDAERARVDKLTDTVISIATRVPSPVQRE